MLFACFIYLYSVHKLSVPRASARARARDFLPRAQNVCQFLFQPSSLPSCPCRSLLHSPSYCRSFRVVRCAFILATGRLLLCVCVSVCETCCCYYLFFIIFFCRLSFVLSVLRFSRLSTPFSTSTLSRVGLGACQFCTCECFPFCTFFSRLFVRFICSHLSLFFSSPHFAHSRPSFPFSTSFLQLSCRCFHFLLYCFLWP